MFYAVGQVTKRVYAVGKSKAVCLRILQADYPTCKGDGLKSSKVAKVLPEPIIIKSGRN